MKGLIEGFFGKPTSINSGHRRMIGDHFAKDYLVQQILQLEKTVTDDDWLFIDKYMDGYYTAEQNDELYQLLCDLTNTYGDDIPLNWIDMSHVTDLSGLIPSQFIGDISRWDVSGAIDMHGMFYNCKDFNSDISSWDVSRVADMTHLFENCFHFNQDLSSWNVSSVNNMRWMFSDCIEFNCDLSGWDVSRVTDMEGMFHGCKKFMSNLSSWDVSRVTAMGGMFYQCSLMASNKHLAPWYIWW